MSSENSAITQTELPGIINTALTPALAPEDAIAGAQASTARVDAHEAIQSTLSDPASESKIGQGENCPAPVSSVCIDSSR